MSWRTLEAHLFRWRLGGGCGGERFGRERLCEAVGEATSHGFELLLGDFAAALHGAKVIEEQSWGGGVVFGEGGSADLEDDHAEDEDDDDECADGVEDLPGGLVGAGLGELEEGAGHSW